MESHLHFLIIVAFVTSQVLFQLFQWMTSHRCDVAQNSDVFGVCCVEIHTAHIIHKNCCSYWIPSELPHCLSYCLVIFQFDNEPLEHLKFCMAVDHTQNLQAVYGILFMHEQLQVRWLNFFDNSDVFESVVVEFTLRNFIFTYRIEQPNMCSIDGLLNALQLCPVIERVCAISHGGKISLESVLVDFVRGSPKLVFLYVQLDTLSEAACKRIKSWISARYVSEWNLYIV